MLAARSRPFVRVNSQLRLPIYTGHRRSMADAPSPSAGREVASPKTNEGIPVARPRRAPRPEDNRSPGFYLMLMGAAILTVPPVSYFYWKHRKAHMKAKKEAILKDIQARVSAAS